MRAAFPGVLYLLYVSYKYICTSAEAQYAVALYIRFILRLRHKYKGSRECGERNEEAVFLRFAWGCGTSTKPDTIARRGNAHTIVPSSKYIIQFRLWKIKFSFAQ